MESNNKPFIIGIAGDSGVGKSTISKIISLSFNNDDILILSTDDLHKWERGNVNWDKFTHLNPESNNLELGDVHLKSLKNGESIYRSIYNHKNGMFNPPTKIIPKNTIIIEGLHSFYTEFSQENIDLKIFIDTEKNLKNHWKIIRDTEVRGHKYNDVLESINRREKDSKNVKDVQISVSDVIIEISTKSKIINIGDKSEKIDLQLDIKSGYEINPKLFKFIEDFNSSLGDFYNISEEMGTDKELFQDKGGNISVKIGDYMIIKPSGLKIKDLNNLDKLSIINLNDLHSENISISNTKLKPSMEFWFHTLLKKYVIHTHPIYLNVILSLKNSEKIIKEIYYEFKYNFINYVKPGLCVYDEIKKIDDLNDIIFLESHGLIVTSNSKNDTIELTYKLNNLAKNYLKNKCGNKFIEFNDFGTDIRFDEHQIYTFPDAAILLLSETDLRKHTETFLSQKYIELIGSLIGELNVFNKLQIYELNNMESEKYRKEI